MAKKKVVEEKKEVRNNGKPLNSEVEERNVIDSGNDIIIGE